MEDNELNSNEFNSSFPGLNSWLLALTCSCILFLALGSIDNAIQSIHKSLSRQRLIKTMNEMKDLKEVLNDSYVSLLPKKEIKNIEKTLALYTTIQNENYKTSKTIINDSHFKYDQKKPELKSHISSLLMFADQNKKEKMTKEEKEKKKEKDDEFKAMISDKNIDKLLIKDKALNIALSILRDEVLPKTEPIGDSVVNKIKSLTS